MMLRDVALEHGLFLIADEAYREFLQPGQKPEAEFCVQAEKVTARDYCNLHGLWKA